MIIDIFNDDAFSLVQLTAAINKIDHVPGRAGELAFAGVGEGVATLSVAIESKDMSLSLIQSTRRNEPAPQNTADKSKLRNLSIPQIKLEETIPVGAVQGVRQFGSAATLAGPQTVINQRMVKEALRHDLTLENHRLGALRGLILDADGSTLLDLYDAFDEDAEDAVDFAEVLIGGSDDVFPDVRALCQQIKRTMVRNLKMPFPGTARIHAFCGDNFFDRLVDCTRVRETFDGYALAESKLGENYAHGVFYFGGVFWENYHGTDDGTTVAIDTDDAQLFPLGVPGLYAEYFAPADFMETANTIGLPRYAKIAQDNKFNREIYLHTQQNPLPLCLRPKVLMRATIASE